MGPLKNMVGTQVISDGRDLINLLVIFRGIAADAAAAISSSSSSSSSGVVVIVVRETDLQQLVFDSTKLGQQGI